MSQDKKKTAQAPESQAPEENAPAETGGADASEKQAPEPQAEVKAGPETAGTSPPQTVSEKDAPGLNVPVDVKMDPGFRRGDEKKAVAEWARKKRLATWQAAALLRSTGWADDKLVSEPDFDKAVALAMNKRQGARG